MPLDERRRRLSDLLASNDVVRFSAHVEGRKGAALFASQPGGRTVLGSTAAPPGLGEVCSCAHRASRNGRGER
jgi:hypothetical protein